MHFVLKIPLVRFLHGRGLLFPAAVLFIVAGVLIHGAFQRVPEMEVARTSKIENVSPSHVGSRPNVEKTILAYESDFWLQLAQSIRSKIDLVSSKNIPVVQISPTLGVASIAAAEQVILDRQTQQFLDDHASWLSSKAGSDNKQTGRGYVLPQAGADDGGSELEGQEEALRLLAVDARLGLALFKLLEPSENPFSLVSPTMLPPGSFVAAITVEADKRLRISPGYLVSAETTGVTGKEIESFEVSFELGEVPATAAVVDLDGTLVGLALRSPDGIRILSAPAVLRVVSQLVEQPICYSIEVADLTISATEILDLRNGVFVESVFEQSFKPSPSIQAGDVILRWAGERVENTRQFYELYEAQLPGNIVRYVVRRGNQRIAGGTVMPGRDCRPIGEPLLSWIRMGVMLEWHQGPSKQEDTAAWRVTAIAEGTPASKSGLMLDDKILSINRLRLRSQNAERIFSSFESHDRSLALVVKRGDRVKLLTISSDEVDAQ